MEEVITIKPEISVIVPVYKVEPYLRRCVDSILAQTFTDFELILVDDGSPDNCPAICDEYAAQDERVHVIHQQNGGQSAARNAGLDWVFQNSDSAWISFVDSDDWVHSEYLNYLYQAAVSNHVLISMCMFERVEDYISESAVTLPNIKIVSPTEAYTYDDSGIFSYAWGRLYSSSLLGETRFPQGRIYEDLSVIYQVLFRTKRIAVITEALYYYYKNNDGAVLSAWTVAKLDSFIAFEEQIVYFESIGDEVTKGRVIKAYINSVYDNYIGVRKTEKDVQEKRKYERMLKGKLRRMLRVHAIKLRIRISDKPWLYEAAYPRLMKYYWLWQVVLKKLKWKK